MGARKLSSFPPGHARVVDQTPRIAANTLRQKAARLAALEAGATPRLHEDIGHVRDVVRRWIEAFREVGVCKRCGERLDGTSKTALLARARGVGTTCWNTKLTADERAAITAWLRRRGAIREEPR